MSAPRVVSLIDLGFGDSGKGLFTDALCRRWQAQTVVRFNGGAQAGHNVVLPDGRHHTFSQFGAGTLIPGVDSVLAYPVVVHPGALWVEYRRLQAIGIHDGLERLRIDGRCRINTPFHQAAGRLRELARGAHAHGTCGVGIGETVAHGQKHPDHLLRYADLARPALAMQKLESIRKDLQSESAAFNYPDPQAPEVRSEQQVLADPNASELWLSHIHALIRQAPPASPERISEHLERAGTVLFEGAQGLLLDEWHGFHPHTTWSSTSPLAAEQVATAYGHTGQLEHLGILRSYLTRHGHGPFPTADSALDSLPEPHNSEQGWQGTFRRGHPDAVLLRYALAVAEKLDGLLLSHLDVFKQNRTLRWCEAYAPSPEADPALFRSASGAAGTATHLTPGAPEDLLHQTALTKLLFGARPLYRPLEIESAEALIEAVQSTTDCPIWLGAFGPTHQTVETLRAGIE